MQTRSHSDEQIRIQELEKRIKELEQKVELVTAHSNDLEDQTREAFSKLVKMVTRLAAESVKFNEAIVSDIEEGRRLAEEEEDN